MTRGRVVSLSLVQEGPVGFMALSSFRPLASSQFDIFDWRSKGGAVDDRKPMGANDRTPRFVRCFFIGLALRGTAYRLGRDGSHAGKDIGGAAAPPPRQ